MLFYLYRYYDKLFLYTFAFITACILLLSNYTTPIVVAGWLLFTIVITLIVKHIFKNHPKKWLLKKYSKTHAGKYKLYSGHKVTYLIGTQDAFIRAVKQSGNLRVAWAANRHPSGLIFAIDRPGRHHDIIRIMSTYHSAYSAKYTNDQGFTLNDGRYVDRVTAKDTAVRAGQLLMRHSNSKELFSECVWESYPKLKENGK